MKNNRNDLDAMLSLLREHPPTRELLSQDDVRRRIADAEKGGSAGLHIATRRRVGIMTVAAIMGIGTAALLLMSTGGREEIVQTSTSVRNRQSVAPTVKGGDSGVSAASPAGTASPAVETHDDDTMQSQRKTADAGVSSPARSRSITYLIGENVGGAPDSSEQPPVDIPGIMVITHTTYDSAEIARNNARRQMTDTALDINGIGALELTVQELERLGVEMTSSGLRLSAEEKYVINDSETARKLHALGYDTTHREFLKRYEIEVDTFQVGLNTTVKPSEKHYSRIVPILIYNQYVKTDLSEGSHLSYFNRSPLLTELITNYQTATADQLERELFNLHNVNTPQAPVDVKQHDIRRFPLASRLVPIYLRLGDAPIEGTTKRRGADIYLWYLPTREFIAALPERYRNRIREELDALAHVESNRLNSEEACECLTGGPTYLDVCRSRSGAVVSASLYPNPAHQASTVSFRLMEARHVTVTLHDINGRYLSTLLGEQELNVGDHHAKLDLDKVSQGTYLVVVRTDRKEQAVQRLIVQ
jgi:hypothetical protein